MSKNFILIKPMQVLSFICNWAIDSWYHSIYKKDSILKVQRKIMSPELFELRFGCSGKISKYNA